MKINILVVLVTLAFFIAIFSAQSQAMILIDIDTPPHPLVDRASFNYTILSDENMLITYSAGIECPSAPFQEHEIKEAQIKIGIPLHDEYHYYFVTKDIEPQTCKAVVSILKPIEQTEERNFGIFIEPRFEFSVQFCKDRECKEKSKTFVKNEEVFIRFLSNLDNPEVASRISFPDGSEMDISIPSSIKTSKIGTYELLVAAAKSGYKTITKKLQFAVLEKDVSIPGYIHCNGNGVCANMENHQNCPQDCPSGSADGICDKVADDKCDPDCPYGDDSDCKVPVEVIVVIVVMVMAVLAVLFTYKRGGKSSDAERAWKELENKYS